MAYQPPGPYPVMPMQPVAGMPQRPPMPQQVQRAYYAILAGGALSVVSLVIGLTRIGSVRDQVRQQLVGFDQQTVDTFVNMEIAAVIFGGLVGLGLWLWMAWKIKTGRHWARVLSTVFFGFEVLSAAVGGLNYSNTETINGQTTTVKVDQPGIAIALGWVTVAVGLYAIVMFWNKANTAYFRPQRFMPPGYPYPTQGYPQPGYPQQGYPQPGFPQQGYPQQGYPQVPGQGGVPPQEPTQQPGDPWGTPPQ